MSDIIYWQPADTGRKFIEGGSSVRRPLENCFGEFPLRLTLDDREKLSAMSFATNEETHGPYLSLIKAIDDHGAIVVNLE